MPNYNVSIYVAPAVATNLAAAMPLGAVGILNGLVHMTGTVNQAQRDYLALIVPSSLFSATAVAVAPPPATSPPPATTTPTSPPATTTTPTTTTPPITATQPTTTSPTPTTSVPTGTAPATNPPTYQTTPPPTSVTPNETGQLPGESYLNELINQAIVNTVTPVAHQAPPATTVTYVVPETNQQAPTTMPPNLQEVISNYTPTVQTGPTQQAPPTAVNFVSNPSFVDPSIFGGIPQFVGPVQTLPPTSVMPVYEVTPTIPAQTPVVTGPYGQLAPVVLPSDHPYVMAQNNANVITPQMLMQLLSMQPNLAQLLNAQRAPWGWLNEALQELGEKQRWVWAPTTGNRVTVIGTSMPLFTTWTDPFELLQQARLAISGIGSKVIKQTKWPTPAADTTLDLSATKAFGVRVRITNNQTTFKYGAYQIELLDNATTISTVLLEGIKAPAEVIIMNTSNVAGKASIIRNDQPKVKFVAADNPSLVADSDILIAETLNMRDIGDLVQKLVSVGKLPA